MTRIGHLFDAAVGWEERVGVTHLLDRIPSDRFTHELLGVHPAARRCLARRNGPVAPLPSFGGVPTLTAPAVARTARRRGIGLLHAWGVKAAVAARAVPELPLVVHLFDPLAAARHVKLLRTMARPDGFAIACSSELVRRRLIEGGVPPELPVVVRPGVDFRLINQARRRSLRRELGVYDKRRVVLLSEPVERSGGQMEACVALMARHHLDGDLAVIVPGRTRETARIARFARSLPLASPLVFPGSGYAFEALVPSADVLLITPRGDAPVTSIAWAMAAQTAVIGTAVHAVAELIANKVNGLLYKQTRGRSMAPAISRLLRDRESQDRYKEAARGQAYEVFGLRRYVEQMMQLYDNVLAGESPAQDIHDPAFVA